MNNSEIIIQNFVAKLEDSRVFNYELDDSVHRLRQILDLANAEIIRLRIKIENLEKPEQKL